MLHELGHGLNLKHNAAKIRSEATQLGTNLMDHGNESFSKGQPTFLSEVDAAILNRNEVFQSKKTGETPYASTTTTLNAKFNIDNTAKTLTISGTYTATNPVSDILVFMDPDVNNEGTGPNRDYNAIAWRFNASNNALAGTIDLKELQYTKNEPYELKIRLLMQNGSVNEKIYDFKYNNSALNIIQDSVSFCSTVLYSGKIIKLLEGNYLKADMQKLGLVNFITSIEIPNRFTNGTVTLFTKDSFAGDSLVLKASNPLLDSKFSKNNVNSIRVKMIPK